MSRATGSPIAVASIDTLDMSGDSMDGYASFDGCASFDDPDMTLVDEPALAVTPPPVGYLSLGYNPGYLPTTWESCIVNSPNLPFQLTNVQTLARKGIAFALSDDARSLDLMPLQGSDIPPEQIRLNVQMLLDKAMVKMPGINITVFLEQEF